MTNLKKARLLAGLTQEQTARELGVSERTWRSYENGGVIPSDVLVGLARLTNMSTDYLLGLLEQN